MNIGESGISWPILIKHENQPELTRVDSLDAWQQLLLEHSWLTGPGDIIVDSTRQSWQVSEVKRDSAHDKVQLEMLTAVSPETLLAYVKHHLSAKGVCCISKFNQDDPASLFKLVSSLDEDE